VTYLLQEEDIDACIQEVNKVLGPSVSLVSSSADDCDFAASKVILSVEHR